MSVLNVAAEAKPGTGSMLGRGSFIQGPPGRQGGRPEWRNGENQRDPEGRASLAMRTVKVGESMRCFRNDEQKPLWL
jgi:hypothetical protein